MTNFIIANEPNFTIQDYNSAIQHGRNEDKIIICEAIKRRLIQRYIKPGELKENKNGFNIMANCCLLIESFESIHRGWKKTPNGSDAFLKFFKRSRLFQEFSSSDLSRQFYINIRCGILHQGETTGGWKIRRDQKQKLNKEHKIIDANYFRNALKKEIEKYFNDLMLKDWNDDEWKMLTKKMKHIIENCK